MAVGLSGPCVTGWSAVSAFGVGGDALAAGVAAGVPAPADARGHVLVGFDAPALIGTRGTRTLDRFTSVVLATAGLVLDRHVPDPGERAGLGLVLGTNTGSVASVSAFLRDTFVRDRPYLVDPAAFPNTVLNGAAGRTAIRYGLKGLNSTVAANHNTGPAALRYAVRMVRAGHARTLLVGCAEELSGAVASAADRLRERRPATVPLGEGCAFFLVEDAATAAEHGRAPLARLVDFAFGVAPRDDPAALADGLARVVGAVLARAGLGPADVWLAGLCGVGDPLLDTAERTAVDRVLADAGKVRRIAAAKLVGNTFSALGAFQAAAALAIAENDPVPVPQRPAILTSVGADGVVACTLFAL